MEMVIHLYEQALLAYENVPVEHFHEVNIYYPIVTLDCNFSNMCCPQWMYYKWTYIPPCFSMLQEDDLDGMDLPIDLDVAEMEEVS